MYMWPGTLPPEYARDTPRTKALTAAFGVAVAIFCADQSRSMLDVANEIEAVQPVTVQAEDAATRVRVAAGISGIVGVAGLGLSALSIGGLRRREP